jgi:hypothetical protein
MWPAAMQLFCAVSRREASKIKRFVASVPRFRIGSKYCRHIIVNSFFQFMDNVRIRARSGSEDGCASFRH